MATWVIILIAIACVLGFIMMGCLVLSIFTSIIKGISTTWIGRLILKIIGITCLLAIIAIILVIILVH